MGKKIRSLYIILNAEKGGEKNSLFVKIQKEGLDRKERREETNLYFVIWGGEIPLSWGKKVQGPLIN